MIVGGLRLGIVPLVEVYSLTQIPWDPFECNKSFCEITMASFMCHVDKLRTEPQRKTNSLDFSIPKDITA